MSDLKGAFDYGFISYRELKERLLMRKCILDVHGEIIPLDDLYEDIKRSLLSLYNGEITVQSFHERFGDYPADIFHRVYESALRDVEQSLVEDDPVKKKRWEILDFS